MKKKIGIGALVSFVVLGGLFVFTRPGLSATAMTDNTLNDWEVSTTQKVAQTKRGTALRETIEEVPRHANQRFGDAKQREEHRAARQEAVEKEAATQEVAQTGAQQQLSTSSQKETTQTTTQEAEQTQEYYDGPGYCHGEGQGRHMNGEGRGHGGRHMNGGGGRGAGQGRWTQE
ncbi:MAG: hypothetical protein ACTH2W_03070 [Vagococcus sp.]